MLGKSALGFSTILRIGNIIKMSPPPRRMGMNVSCLILVSGGERPQLQLSPYDCIFTKSDKVPLLCVEKAKMGTLAPKC